MNLSALFYSKNKQKKEQKWFNFNSNTK